MKDKELQEQLKTKPPEELRRELTQYGDRLWSLKNDLAAGKVKNVKEIKKVKRTMAQILTLLTNKAQ